MVPTINHVIGQHDAVARFKVALEASWNDATKLPHMLFVGGPGLGKTMLAQLAAKELGVTLHERLAQVVNFVGALNGLLIQAGHKEIVFLDEIHELLPSVQTVLYRAMEGQQISVRTRDDRSVNMSLKDFSVIGATTDEYRLLGPLRDRFKVVLPFTDYDDESMTKIILQRAQLMSFNMEPEVATQIAMRSRGVPRLGIRLLESCHRYSRSRGDDKVKMSHFENTVRLDGIDSLGLGPDEQRFVKFLMNQRGRPVRLFTIEAAIGVHRRTIQDVIEPFLLRKGLIERTQHGRVITKAGAEHCEACENSVEGRIV
jgi:holliday junction DNA helicase RuvB